MVSRTHLSYVCTGSCSCLPPLRVHDLLPWQGLARGSAGWIYIILLLAGIILLSYIGSFKGAEEGEVPIGALGVLALLHTYRRYRMVSGTMKV